MLGRLSGLLATRVDVMDGAEDMENLGEAGSTENLDGCMRTRCVLFDVPSNALPSRHSAAHLQLPHPRPHSRRRTQCIWHLERTIQATQTRSHTIR